jgi:curved DNA-binding protein CbpA
MPEPYNVLGVEAGASDAAIKAAFRRAAKKCHPDMNAGNRAGERRLKRLIAARDFLLSHGRRLSSRKRAGQVPRLGAFRQRRVSIIAGALTGAGFLVFLIMSAAAPVIPANAPFQTSVIEETEDDPLPDAESAGLKAIRDSREFPAEPAEPRKTVTDGAAARDKNITLSPVSRHHAPRLKRAVTEATATVTKTWWRFASKLSGP